MLFFNGSVIHGSLPEHAAGTASAARFICHYVPASTKEMSDYYEAYDFSGHRQPIATNDDGGPCGTPQDLPTGPH